MTSITPNTETENQNSESSSNVVVGGSCLCASDKRACTDLNCAASHDFVAFSASATAALVTAAPGAVESKTSSDISCSVAESAGRKRQRDERDDEAARERLRHAHPLPAFDDLVYMDVPTHTYYVLDYNTDTYRRFKGSCTGLIAEHEPQFNRELVYEQMRVKGRFDDPKDRYYGMTRDQVFAAWEGTSDDASEFGSEMHAAIELDLNGGGDREHDEVWQSVENGPSLKRYAAFHRDYILQPGEQFGVAANREGGPKARAWRTELTMFDADYEFAGQADVLLELPDGTFVLGDWKRTKKDLNENRFKKYFMRFLSHLEHTKLNVYRLQMSLYALCVQKFAPHIRIVELRLGVFHYNNPSYLWLRVEPLFAEARALLEWRRGQIQHAHVSAALEVARRLASTTRALAAALPDECAALAADGEEAERAVLDLHRLLYFNKPWRPSMLEPAPSLST